MSEVAKAAERAGSVELCISSDWDAQRWPVAAADVSVEAFGVDYANMCGLFYAAYPGKLYGDFKKWWGDTIVRHPSEDPKCKGRKRKPAAVLQAKLQQKTTLLHILRGLQESANQTLVNQLRCAAGSVTIEMIARSEAVCEDTQNAERKAELAQHIAVAKGVAAMWNGQGGIITINHFIVKVKSEIPATELQSGEHKYHDLCCMHVMYDVAGEEPRGPVTTEQSAPVMEVVPIEPECDGHEVGDDAEEIVALEGQWGKVVKLLRVPVRDLAWVLKHHIQGRPTTKLLGLINDYRAARVNAGLANVKSLDKFGTLDKLKVLGYQISDFRRGATFTGEFTDAIRTIQEHCKAEIARLKHNAGVQMRRKSEKKADKEYRTGHGIYHKDWTSVNIESSYTGGRMTLDEMADLADAVRIRGMIHLDTYVKHTGIHAACGLLLA